MNNYLNQDIKDFFINNKNKGFITIPLVLLTNIKLLDCVNTMSLLISKYFEHKRLFTNLANPYTLFTVKIYDTFQPYNINPQPQLIQLQYYGFIHFTPFNHNSIRVSINWNAILNPLPKRYILNKYINKPNQTAISFKNYYDNTKTPPKNTKTPK